MYNPYQDALHQRYPRALIVGHRDLSHDRDCPCDHGLYLDNHSQWGQVLSSGKKATESKTSVEKKHRNI